MNSGNKIKWSGVLAGRSEVVRLTTRSGEWAHDPGVFLCPAEEMRKTFLT